MVFKGGAGVAGISMSKWSSCRSVTMCDLKDEVVKNMKKNCMVNKEERISIVLLNLN